MYPDSWDSLDECYETLNEIADDCKYAIFGNETCPTTGRHHLQGYVMFKTRIRFSALRKKYFPTIHWEAAKGTLSQNIDYCSKDDPTPMEFGERPKYDDNGAREADRWKQARMAAQEDRFEDIPDQIFVSHYKNVKSLRDDSKTTDQVLDAPCGIWLYGVPGSGKSTKARTEYGTVYFKDTNMWWDGYRNEETVVLEDIDPSHSYLCRQLKIWTDVCPFPAQTKGGYTKIRPKNVVVTSNYSIEEVFPTPIDQEALKRRFKVVFFPFQYGHTPPVE